MYRILHLALTLVLLTGCQTASLSELDYNTRLDFSSWQHWQWASPGIELTGPNPASELDADRLHDIISNELLQWGYLQTGKPDFLVRARLGREQHTERVYYRHGSHYWNDPWSRYRGPGWIESREVHYQVLILHLELLDARTGKLAWRASEQWPASHSQKPAQREAELRKAASKLLRQFPPGR